MGPRLLNAESLPACRPGTASCTAHCAAKGTAPTYCRYSSEDPLDLGEALWLAHWQLPGAPWAGLVSEVGEGGGLHHAHDLSCRTFGKTGSHTCDCRPCSIGRAWLN
jgi:hypothetical protein